MATIAYVGDRWIVDASKNGHRYVVQAETLLNAFIELQWVTRQVVGYFAVV